MKVYAITEGEYSDYHIVGIVLDKKVAEQYCKLHKRYSYEPMVEEYDTDFIQYLVENQSGLYSVCSDGDVSELECPDYYFNDLNRVSGRGVFQYTYVLAESEDDARKKAFDIFAEYKARKEGIS